MNVRIAITEIVQRVSVTIQEAGGTTITVTQASRPANVPWSAITGKPDNLLTGAVDDDQLYAEISTLDGTPLTKVPYIPE